MTFTELIAAYAGPTHDSQLKDLTVVLAKVISDKYGRGVRALPEMAKAVPTLTEMKDNMDTMPLLKVLDSIVECIATKMMECQDFDIFDLRHEAEQFMSSEIQRRKTIISETQSSSL